MQAVDFPAGVSHAGSSLDSAAAIQLGVTSERVGLEHTDEVSEMSLRMLTAAIGCVGEPDRRRFVGASEGKSRLAAPALQFGPGTF